MGENLYLEYLALHIYLCSGILNMVGVIGGSFFYLYL